MKNSREIAEKADFLLGSPGFVLLVSLLNAVYEYKGLASVNFPSSTEFFRSKTVKKLNSSVSDIKKPPIRPVRSHLKAESFSMPLNTSKEQALDSPVDQFETTEFLKFSYDNGSGEFQDSKKILLDRFFNKMNTSEVSESFEVRSPLKSLLNKSIEIVKSLEKPASNIKIKPSNRPSSTTPKMTQKIEVELKTKEPRLVMANSQKIQELKLKNIMIGSRFYKKVSEKFVEVLIGKMKKEPKELKKLKTANPEEYAKKKNEYILLNKNSWVKETLKSLETSEFSNIHNENFSLKETKREALSEYLSQEKNLIPLITKAEQFELSQRKCQA